jgi:hypothetical protein
MQPEASAEQRVCGIGDFDLVCLARHFVGCLGTWVLEGGIELFNRFLSEAMTGVWLNWRLAASVYGARLMVWRYRRKQARAQCEGRKDS